MTRPELEIAKELINEKQYDKARALLQKVASDPTAQRWLEQLDAIAPNTQPDAQTVNGVSPWQYAALEVKRSYGIQYRVNGEAKPDWKDQPIHYTLNQLGREGWELIGFESANEMSIYVLKRPGVANIEKIEVWDQ
jgi:hypothetical protein